MKFKRLLAGQNPGQNFDIHEKVTKAGQTYEVYEKIQEAREDTELYPTLERYGCIDKMIVNKEELYGDFTQFKDLRSMHDQQIKADEMWLKLPADVRKQFENNKNLFMDKGEQWLKDQIEAEKKQLELQQQAVASEIKQESVKE